VLGGEMGALGGEIGALGGVIGSVGGLIGTLGWGVGGLGGNGSVGGRTGESGVWATTPARITDNTNKNLNILLLDRGGVKNNKRIFGLGEKWFAKLWKKRNTSIRV